MTTYYKLTDEHARTYGGCQWGENVTHSGTGRGPLCGPGWIHVYDHPLLAVLLNPIHANFQHPRLWEAEGRGVTLDDHGLKRGVQTITTLREIPLPVVTTTHRVAFAVLCGKAVCHDPAWTQWADNWLTGKNRTAAVEAAAAAAVALVPTSPFSLIALAEKAMRIP